jgi:hypothetical protein
VYSNNAHFHKALETKVLTKMKEKFCPNYRVYPGLRPKPNRSDCLASAEQVPGGEAGRGGRNHRFRLIVGDRVV